MRAVADRALTSMLIHPPYLKFASTRRRDPRYVASTTSRPAR
jgi:hypothetical protein